MRWAILLLFCISCAKQPPLNSPKNTIDEYCNAVEEKDTKKIYSLLDGEVKQRFPTQEEFDIFFQKNYQEIAKEAKQLSSSSIREEAILSFQDSTKAILIKEPEGWRVATDPSIPAGFSVQETIIALAMLAKTQSSAFSLYLSKEANQERKAQLLSLALLLESTQETNIKINELHAEVILNDGRVLRFRKTGERWYLMTIPVEFL